MLYMYLPFAIATRASLIWSLDYEMDEKPTIIIYHKKQGNTRFQKSAFSLLTNFRPTESVP